MKSNYVNLKETIDLEKIEKPAQAIKEGKLVVFPTETVYGIGANALDSKAVEKIFIAKGRAQDNPLIAHISNLSMLDRIVEKPNEIEQKLIEKFWPGPLTIILNKKKIIPLNVTAGLNTVAVRFPSNIIAQKLIEYSNCPIVAPSANVSGRPSGTTIEDILQELDGKVEYFIDGGASQIGVESTVVRVVNEEIHILRPGRITKEDLESLNFKVIIEKQVLGKCEQTEKVMSPGMKYRHYAPKTKCILIYSKDNAKIVEEINNIMKTEKNILILSRKENIDKYDTSNKLDIGNTLEEISRNIFTYLRKVDSYNVDLVIIEGVEKEGLGLAIMNRLLRACEYNYLEI